MIISIIIPYHTCKDYLRDCLDSLKEQCRKNIEILLICDRVRDDELSLLSEYDLELTIRVFSLKGKKGVAAARNLGLDKATGDYVYFLDSDDYLYGNTIENLALAAQDRYDDIVYGGKKPTWFGRSVYLIRRQEQQKDDAEEEEDNSDNEPTQLNIENESGDTNEEGSEDETGENSEGHDLTPEEQEHKKQVCIRQAYRVLVNKRGKIGSISVLNILFKRSFIEENHIRFQEDLKYYSDIPFLMETLSKTEKFKKRLSALYIKRKHNDAVNNPALSQVKDPKRFTEFIYAYHSTVNKIPQNSDLKNQFDKNYLSYYTHVFAPKLKRNEEDEWRKEYFVSFSDIVKDMDPKVFHNLKGYKKRIIKALIKKDIRKSIIITSLHLARIKYKKIIKSRREMAKFLYSHIFLKQSLKENWIILESFYGKNYSDSPKYIYEYLQMNYHGKYKFIWVLNQKNKNVPFKHRQIKRYGIFYAYYLARCKYIVFNERQPLWVKKREGNIFLQTWHGTPLKKLVFDIDDISSASPKYKQEVYKQSRDWDYLIAPNAFCSETFRRCFLYDNKLLETGYPRNDILYAQDRDALAGKIREKLRIPDDKKVILYAPTWRDDEFYGHGQYKFELSLNMSMLKEQLGDKYVILLRMHYFIADKIDVSDLHGFAYDLSKYDDISELYLISDILITDYSSVFFDYANLKRPMLFFTYDLEKYKNVLRGFYFNIEELVPGPLLFTTEEVIDAVKSIEKIDQKYSQKYQDFYNRFCAWEDGHAAKKVVESVFIRF
jgi:CDP-glycerol glycerophosphotransferase